MKLKKIYICNWIDHKRVSVHSWAREWERKCTQEAIIFSSRSFTYSFWTRSDSWLGPRPEFLVLTGSPGCLGQFHFLNQYEVILVKKKKSTGCNRVLLGQPDHPKFFHSLFFLKPGSVPTPDPGSTRQVGFQNYGFTPSTLSLFFPNRSQSLCI